MIEILKRTQKKFTKYGTMLEKSTWNDKLWEEGIMQTTFRNGATLKLLSDYFNKKSNKELAKMIGKILSEYYNKWS